MTTRRAHGGKLGSVGIAVQVVVVRARMMGVKRKRRR
jgi:hypothetical protein